MATQPTQPTPRKKRECVSAWIGDCKGKVTYGPDPLAAEVYNDQTKVWECDYHREQSALDV